MIRLLPVLLLVLTAAFAWLVIRDRLRERRKLQEEWVLRGRQGARGAFVRQGLRAYDESRRGWRFVVVYLVPLCVIVLIVYLTNFA